MGMHRKGIPVKPRRGYSREFTALDGGAQLNISNVPRELIAKVRRRAAREGISMRYLILAGLRAWAAAEPVAPPLTLRTPKRK